MRVLAGAIASCVLLAACGPGGTSGADVIAKYKPKVEAMRAKALAIADRMPPPGMAQPTARFTDVLKPFYGSDVYDPAGQSNVAFVPIEALQGEQIPKHDYRMQSMFANALERIGEHYYLAGNEADGLDEAFKAALDTRFIGVYREAAYTASRMIDDKTFEPGSLMLELFLIDMTYQSVIATCIAVGGPGDEVTLTRSKDFMSYDADMVVNLTHDAMMKEVWSKFEPCLVKQTGGVFAF